MQLCNGRFSELFGCVPVNGQETERLQKSSSVEKFFSTDTVDTAFLYFVERYFLVFLRLNCCASTQYVVMVTKETETVERKHS